MDASASSTMNRVSGFSITEKDKEAHEILSEVFKLSPINEFVKTPRDKLIKLLRGQVQRDIGRFRELDGALKAGKLEVPYSYDELQESIQAKRAAFCRVYPTRNQSVTWVLGAHDSELKDLEKRYKEAEQNREFRVLPSVETERVSDPAPEM